MSRVYFASTNRLRFYNRIVLHLCLYWPAAGRKRQKTASTEAKRDINNDMYVRTYYQNLPIMALTARIMRHSGHGQAPHQTVSRQLYGLLPTPGRPQQWRCPRGVKGVGGKTGRTTSPFSCCATTKPHVHSDPLPMQARSAAG